jgi:hypothetical protein
MYEPLVSRLDGLYWVVSFGRYWIVGNDFARISQEIDFTLRIVGFVIKDVIFLTSSMNSMASLSNTNTSSTHKTPIIKLSNSFEEVVPMLIPTPHVFLSFASILFIPSYT